MNTETKLSKGTGSDIEEAILSISQSYDAMMKNISKIQQLLAETRELLKLYAKSVAEV